LGSYTVEHISNADVITDITLFVHTVDSVKMFSDGRISTASLTLQAQFGYFMTNTNGGLTPIINTFDRIRLTGTDKNGDEQKHIFEVINDLGQVTKDSEYLLPLTLEGRERNLAAVPFSGYFDALNHHAMVERILTTYGVTRDAPLQPVIDSDDGSETNLLPTYNPNIWDFQYIDNCLDAIKSVVRLANQSVAAGGTGDRWAILFEDDATVPLTKMAIRIISQGTNNIPSARPTIRANMLQNPIIQIPRVIQPPTGTVVIARGRPGSGGVPVAGDKYRSRLEFFQRIQSRQIWDSTVTYPVDSYASLGGVVYKATTENTNDKPPSGNWTSQTAADFIGALQYSPFTKDKATVFKNECTNPNAAFASETESSPKMLDCNIVIDDAETQRDWCHIRQTTDVTTGWSVQEKHYLFRDTSVYDGFRILLDTSLGALGGVFAAGTDSYGTGNGNDPNGVAFADNVVVYARDSNGDFKWFVVKAHEDYDQVLVRFEGLFEWNVNFVAKSRFPASDTTNANRRKRQAGAGGTFAWRALGEQFLANDCLHSPSSIVNSDGLIDPVAQPVSGNYTDNSAVKIIYEYGNKTDMPEWRQALDKILGVGIAVAGFAGTFLAAASAALADLFFTPYYRNMGWWITLSSPFPFNNNVISEEVGELYGSGTSLLVSTLNDHSTFDAFNQTSTFTGKDGWFEDDSNGMMEITGVTFLYRLDIQNNGDRIPFTGDIPCSYWALDDNGTLWKSKQKYRLLGDVQRFTFDFGDFSPVYRARTPFGINEIITNILTPELEIRERLFANRIRIQGFMLEGSYDEHGRYMPNIWETIIKPSIMTMFDPSTITNNVEFIGEIDYWQWVKTPIAISSDPSLTRVIFPDIKDYPNISNLEQLQRAADADVDVELFQYEQYELTRNNAALPDMQDTVYLFEKNMIPQAEAPRVSGPAWSGVTTYAVDDIVDSGGNTYICIAINTNQMPPNTEFWLAQTDPVANTRELTVGEINWSVTDGKEVQFQHTLIRRIPKV
jgi:hypothetical protein